VITSAVRIGRGGFTPYDIPWSGFCGTKRDGRSSAHRRSRGDVVPDVTPRNGAAIRVGTGSSARQGGTGAWRTWCDVDASDGRWRVGDSDSCVTLTCCTVGIRGRDAANDPFTWTVTTIGKCDCCACSNTDTTPYSTAEVLAYPLVG
jgi:hypothetical protein